MLPNPSQLGTVTPVRSVLCVEPSLKQNWLCGSLFVFSTNPQPVLGDLAHGDAMKAQWIWSVGRSRPKDISERATMVRARMDFWTVAPGPVEPTTYLINNRDSYPFRSTAFPEAFRR